jgi:hypothetical protein
MARRHEIPTHLDVEDKLFAGLTPRQLLLLCLGVGLGYSVWQRWHHALPLPLALPVAALPVLVGVVFATLRPDDRPLEQWLLTVARYAALARVCVASRGPEDTLDALDASSLAHALADVEAEWRALQDAAGASAPARVTDEWGLVPAAAPAAPTVLTAGPSLTEAPTRQHYLNG